MTDHNTYNGYRYWKHNIKGKRHTDFVVLKGIEYDTRDAGHMLVIMPEGVKMRLLELRGMRASVLIDLVHRNGGVIGPAHPYGEKYQSFANTKRFYKSPELVKRFDFVEAYNCCENAEANAKALRLAKKYNKVTVGGSDSHKTNCVGRAYTILPEPVSCETELISMIHKKTVFETGGTYYDKTTKERMGKVNKILVYSFWVYNKAGELLRRHGQCENGAGESGGSGSIRSSCIIQNKNSPDICGWFDTDIRAVFSESLGMTLFSDRTAF